MPKFLPIPNAGGDFKPCPDGTHLAICYRVIDLGTQRVEYQGQTKEQRKVLIGWELPGERMEDGRPFSIGQRYSWSMHEKSRLRHDLESWRGKKFEQSDFGAGGFDISNLIGKPCLLSIVHTEKDGKTYANIASVSKLVKGMEVPKMENETVFFDLDNLDRAEFDKLSDTMKKIIEASPEYSSAVRGPAPSSHPLDDDFRPDDDLPF